MRLDSIKMLWLFAVITLPAVGAGCRVDADGGVGSDVQGLRGDAGSPDWDRDKDADEIADEASGDGGGRGPWGGRGFGDDDDDADGGADERDCRGGWRGGFGHRGDGDRDDDGDWGDWGGRR
jgi:hypothetical protein